MSRNAAVVPYKNKSLNKYDYAIIYIPLTFSVYILRVIKSYLDTKDHFDRPLLQMFSLFIPLGLIVTPPTLATQPKCRIVLYRCIQYAPQLLAEKLGCNCIAQIIIQYSYVFAPSPLW